MDRGRLVEVLGRVHEDEGGVAVDVVVLGGEGEPGALGAHELARVGVGVRGEDGATGEVARAAPLESGVAGHLTARGGRGTEGQGFGTDVGEADRPVQGPGAGLLVDRVDGQPPHLASPLLAAVLDPGELLGEGEAAVLDREVREAVVPHRADALGQGQIALTVDVAVAAPEVLAGQMTRGHLKALVPAVVVRPVAGDRAAGQGAHRVGVRLAGLERIRVGAVDVAEDLRAVRRRDGDVLAVGVRDSDAHARSLGAQSGYSPCMAS